MTDLETEHFHHSFRLIAIRAAMTAAGYDSLRQLADASGVSRRTITKWLGRKPAWKVIGLYRLFELLEMTADEYARPLHEVIRERDNIVQCADALGIAVDRVAAAMTSADNGTGGFVSATNLAKVIRIIGLDPAWLVETGGAVYRTIKQDASRYRDE